jgi:DNA polymerase-1
MAQFGNATDSYVVPARYKEFIAWVMRRDIFWIGHNGPHDIRSLDTFLGYETGVVCQGETYIPSHHLDSRNQKEGGTGHGLKELAIAHIDRDAGKWEVALKKKFKEIIVPMPGEFFKSGPRRGQPKTRKAKLGEGWALINHRDPAYIAYAGADPILTFRVWQRFQSIVTEFNELYEFDHAVQMACDRLQRRALLCDVEYTVKLSNAFTSKAQAMQARAAEYGCINVHSGIQVADTLLRLGVKLTERTPSGLFKVDDHGMRAIMAKAQASNNADVVDFVRCVLVAKQLLKRRENYTDAFLREMDDNNRVHPSINTLGARTARMSVSKPALQQLPTKDRDDEI